MATNPDGFWRRLVVFLMEVIEVVESLATPGEDPHNHQKALDLVDAWYRRSGIRIRYLPAALERWVIRRIAAGLIDALRDVLRKQPTGAMR